MKSASCALVRYRAMPTHPHLFMHTGLMAIHTHYDNLKIARNAPPEIVRAAYKALSQKFHPDRHPDKELATRTFQLINTAYEVLSDPVKRKDHDDWITMSEAEPRNSPPPPQSPYSPRHTPYPPHPSPYPGHSRDNKSSESGAGRWKAALDFQAAMRRRPMFPPNMFTSTARINLRQASKVLAGVVMFAVVVIGLLNG